LADATAFSCEVVKFDAGAPEVFALLEPELVAGVAGGGVFVVVGAAVRVTVFTGCVTVFPASVTVLTGGGAACCVTVLVEPPHPPTNSPTATTSVPAPARFFISTPIPLEPGRNSSSEGIRKMRLRRPRIRDGLMRAAYFAS
jgi:hypothetical protein